MINRSILGDFDYLIERLPKLHCNLYNLITQREYQALANLIRQEISSPNFPPAGFELSLLRLFSAIKDPHTIVIPTGPIIPAYFDWVFDAYYLLMVSQEFKSFLGKQLEQINNLPLSEFLFQAEKYLVYNNPEYQKIEISNALRNPGLINRITCSFSQIVSFGFSDGTKITLKAVPRGTKVPRASIFSFKGNEWLDPKTNYAIDSHPGYLYLRYSRCHEDTSYPLDRFYHDIDKTLNRHPVKIIVDFRENGGGDSRVFDPIIDRFKYYHSKNQVIFFGLINRNVFSSGILNTYNYQKTLVATLVGQATGQGINHYGDVKYLLLPNTNTKIGYSTKYFEEPGMEHTAAINPDIYLEPTINDLMEGNDIVLKYCQQN